MFIAQYTGFCHDCKEMVLIGDECEYNTRDELVHVDCDAIDRDEPVQAEVCEACNLTLPCFCQ